MKKPSKKLQNAWKKRLELLNKGYDMFYSRSYKHPSEAHKLRKMGEDIFQKAITSELGEIKIQRKNWNCYKRSDEFHLGNGMVFKP
jgi:hypothetical protein